MEVQRKGRPAEKEKRSPGGAARSVLAERESNGRRRREGQAVWSLGVAGLWVWRGISDEVRGGDARFFQGKGRRLWFALTESKGGADGGTGRERRRKKKSRGGAAALGEGEEKVKFFWVFFFNVLPPL